MTVIKGLLFRAPEHAVSDNEAVTLAEVAAGRDFTNEPEQRTGQSGQRTKRAKRAPGSLLENFPGLAATLDGHATGSSSARSSAEGVRREEEEGQADPWEDAGEDEIIQAFF